VREAALHTLAVAGFGILAVVWSWPLAWHLSTHLTGAGLGDNAVFAWNFWWMRTALSSGTDFFRTSFLFVPVGADLTLHTHTALTAFVGATVLRQLSVVAALNVTILVSLALNGFCTYVLAWRLTRDWGASILAGVIFGTSPYIAAHLNGHFNLINAWTIPLFALTILPAVKGSRTWAALAGLILAMTAYVDYYYVVYELALALSVLAGLAWRWSFSVRTGKASARWLVAVIDTCLVLDAVALVAIAATGGFSVRVGPVPVSMKGTYNPLQLFWVLIALAIWLRLRPTIAARTRESWEWTRFWPALSVMTAVFALSAAPLLWKGVGLVVRGQYVTQQYYWRSAPTGIDAATLFFGNPFHGLYGAVVQRFYRVGAGISLVEGGAWLGLAPVGLAIYAVRHRWSDPAVRQWLVVGLMFFAWALGPHLSVLGRDTGMILPQTLLRYIPIASNARMPGRAMVGVYLALATLGALAATGWKAAHGGSSWLVPALCLAVFADFLAAPFPMAPIECPHIYQTLRDRPERGALAELPLGIGDGLMGLTPVDHRMFLCQMTHGRPLVGGVLARIPPNVLPSYEADPLLSGWLRLSGFDDQTSVHTALPDAAHAAERMRADGIAFIMLDRERASGPLREYVEQVMPLTLVAVEGGRSLYATR
jgi:hypothetical protein